MYSETAPFLKYQITFKTWLSENMYLNAEVEVSIVYIEDNVFNLKPHTED